MEIKIKNDGKGKAQSYEAVLEAHSEHNYWGYYNLYVAGYGANEYSAKEKLRKDFKEYKEFQLRVLDRIEKELK